MCKSEDDGVVTSVKPKLHAVYFDTPVAFGGIRIGTASMSKDDAVTFNYTKLDGSPGTLEFKNEQGFKRWLMHYMVNMGNVFDDARLRIKYNLIKDA